MFLYILMLMFGPAPFSMTPSRLMYGKSARVASWSEGRDQRHLGGSMCNVPNNDVWLHAREMRPAFPHLCRAKGLGGLRVLLNILLLLRNAIMSATSDVHRPQSWLRHAGLLWLSARTLAAHASFGESASKRCSARARDMRLRCFAGASNRALAPPPCPSSQWRHTAGSAQRRRHTS